MNRHRPRRRHGLSRCAGAGDDGAGLVWDRVPAVADGWCGPKAPVIQTTKKPRTTPGLLNCRWS